MKPLVPIMAASLLLAACGGGGAPADTAQAGPMVHLPAVPGRPAAGYFELRIEGERGALVAVTSPQARRIEMHETMTSGTMTSMRPIARLPVRDGETLRFAPGGRHLMLFDLDPAVQAGGRMDLTFRFERGAPVSLAFTAMAPGGEHEGH